MKRKRFFKKSLFPAGLAISATATAQLTSPLTLETPREEPLNRFGASFRAAFNVGVNFENFGAFQPLAAGRLTPDGDAYNYDDGYVLTDSSGNVMGYTRYWGYDYDGGPLNQVAGDGTIVMHQNSSAGTSSSAGEDEMQPGFEITYARQLGRGENWRWGIEAGLGYMNVSVKDSSPMSLSVNRLGVPFQLPMLEGGGFVSPPPAPYAHGAELSSEGNPVINATPLPSNSSTLAASVTGSREFDADVFTARVGPYLELRAGDKWAFEFSGGLALAQVNSDFKFTEAVQLPGVPAASGNGSNSDLLFGGYIAATASYKLNDNWAFFSGVQFQSLGDYTHRENGRVAELTMSHSVFVVVGASISF